ncbi:winged helix-turn-helix domain-containing protein [Mycetohabitans sp. B46]|uniref:winged helix-turn-helix domain-containing protein n=1 Tax=Mycetohabitans sp. B46 TaxID=2772536 RepID=UPI00307F4430
MRRCDACLSSSYTKQIAARIPTSYWTRAPTIYGHHVSRAHMAGAVWRSPEDVVARTLRQHIDKLRQKLELNGAHGVQLRTLYRCGYRLEDAISR